MQPLKREAGPFLVPWLTLSAEEVGDTWRGPQDQTWIELCLESIFFNYPIRPPLIFIFKLFVGNTFGDESVLLAR